jgi:putative oxidoreductase
MRQPYTQLQDGALLFLRVIIAVTFLYAAYAKLAFWSGTPEGMSAGMTNLVRFLSIVEPLGAIAVLVGFLTRWAAVGLAIIMVGAIYVTQFVMHIGFATPTGPGWNFPLVVLPGCIILVAFGAGSWSVDAMREARRWVWPRITQA